MTGAAPEGTMRTPDTVGSTGLRTARREAAARWFVLLGGMIAFALHLLTAFYLVPVSCVWGTLAPLSATTVILAGVAALAIVMGWTRRSATGDVERPEWAPGRGSRTHRVRFMIYAGLVLNVLGLAYILYGGTAIFVFDPCLNWEI